MYFVQLRIASLPAVHSFYYFVIRFEIIAQVGAEIFIVLNDQYRQELLLWLHFNGRSTQLILQCPHHQQIRQL